LWTTLSAAQWQIKLVTEKNVDDISNLIKIMFLIAPHFPILIQQKVGFIRPIKLPLFSSKRSVVGGDNLT
jgi:hypothetical protein